MQQVGRKLRWRARPQAFPDTLVFFLSPGTPVKRKKIPCRQFDSKYLIVYFINSCTNKLNKYVCGIGCMFGERLFACMRNWVHVCGVGCVSGERSLVSCMRNVVHVCGVGCMSGERSLACLRSWVLVWEQGAFANSKGGPGPGPAPGPGSPPPPQ